LNFAQQVLLLGIALFLEALGARRAYSPGSKSKVHRCLVPPKVVNTPRTVIVPDPNVESPNEDRTDEIGRAIITGDFCQGRPCGERNDAFVSATLPKEIIVIVKLGKKAG
jgi:hypothetical protein